MNNFGVPGVMACLNLSFIILIAMYIGITKDINTQAIKKVDELEIRLNAYENMRPDTVIINVNNYIYTNDLKKKK